MEYSVLTTRDIAMDFVASWKGQLIRAKNDKAA